MLLESFINMNQGSDDYLSLAARLSGCARALGYPYFFSISTTIEMIKRISNTTIETLSIFFLNTKTKTTLGIMPTTSIACLPPISLSKPSRLLSLESTPIVFSKIIWQTYFLIRHNTLVIAKLTGSTTSKF
jgi:hypothetical protein